MKTFTSNKGSVLLLALILGAVLLTGAAAMLSVGYTEARGAKRDYLSNASFHLAEAGLEMAARAIATAGVDATTVISEDNIDFGNGATGRFEVAISPALLDPNKFTASAWASVTDANTTLTSERALQAVYESGGGASEGSPGFALQAKDSIKLNHSGGGNSGTQVRIASYNSSSNFGKPDWVYNKGYDAAVGVQNSNNGKIEMNNAEVHGTLRTGGGNPNFSTSGPAPSILKGPDTPANTNIDYSRVTKDFSGDFTSPSVPALDGSWNKTILDQNDNTYKNKKDMSMGSLNAKTYIYMPNSFDTQNKGTLTITGDVILEIQRGMNFKSELVLNPGATLKIYLTENVSFMGNCGDYAPARFEINQMGSSDVVLNSFQIFTGIINAPRSNVRLHGTQNNGTKCEVRGSVTANYIEVTNGTDIFYDTNSGGAATSGGDDSLVLVDWQQLTPAVAKQEIAAAKQANN